MQGPPPEKSHPAATGVFGWMGQPFKRSIGPFNKGPSQNEVQKLDGRPEVDRLGFGQKTTDQEQNTVP